MLDQIREALPTLGAAAAVAACYLHFSVRRPRVRLGDDVHPRVFCLHCNWEGEVSRRDARCPLCHGRRMHVLSV